MTRHATSLARLAALLALRLLEATFSAFAALADRMARKPEGDTWVDDD